MYTLQLFLHSFFPNQVTAPAGPIPVQQQIKGWLDSQEFLRVLGTMGVIALVTSVAEQTGDPFTPLSLFLSTLPIAAGLCAFYSPRAAIALLLAVVLCIVLFYLAQWGYELLSSVEIIESAKAFTPESTGMSDTQYLESIQAFNAR